jgi:hypothetical protein
MSVRTQDPEGEGNVLVVDDKKIYQELLRAASLKISICKKHDDHEVLNI